MPEKSLQDKREIAKERARELKGRIDPYLAAREQIPDGMTDWEKIKERQEKIKKLLNVGDKEWNDWRWQISRRNTKVETLAKVLDLSPDDVETIQKVGDEYRWAVSPYYLSLMDPKEAKCAVRRQAVPCGEEFLDFEGKSDPMNEEFTSPAAAITRRYPDRLIINVTNQCAMYCRHCQRRRNIGESDRTTPRDQLEAAVNYVRKNVEIRDVLLTGGDAFMLNNEKIDWLLTELDNIPHVEIKRLGTRTLVKIGRASCRERV